ncbi:hypothetical protein [Salinarimonas rosea]|uniref:hypothetical protein n=1 Tax=Salinarimonas rosea TaxID=552063 RepID=UPI0003F73B2A|nr:hypothetical protein [Salinarimonas rosea]
MSDHKSFVDMLEAFAHGRLESDPQPCAPTRKRRRDRSMLPPQRRVPSGETEISVDLDWNDVPSQHAGVPGRDVIENS